MRIISGKYKRKKLITLDGDLTRPTKDMVKEALFDTIQIFTDSSFLDLFAGSGSIGIEAISRGANNVIFNDSNKDAVKVINDNLKNINESNIVYNLDYLDCLDKLKGNSFDYIYLDPPYVFNNYLNIFEHISKYNLLNNEGIIIIETKLDTNISNEYLDYHCFKDKKYGITKLYYFRKEDK